MKRAFIWGIVSAVCIVLTIGIHQWPGSADDAETEVRVKEVIRERSYSPKIRGFARKEYYEALVKRDPKLACKDLEGKELRNYGKELLEAFAASSNPEDARDLIQELSKSQSQWSNISDFFLSVLSKDMALALQMFGELPPSDLSGNIAGDFGYRVALKDPKLAIVWVQSLEDYTSKEAMEGVVNYLNDGNRVFEEEEKKRYLEEIEKMSDNNEKLYRYAKERLKLK